MNFHLSIPNFLPTGLLILCIVIMAGEPARVLFVSKCAQLSKITECKSAMHFLVMYSVLHCVTDGKYCSTRSTSSFALIAIENILIIKSHQQRLICIS